VKPPLFLKKLPLYDEFRTFLHSSEAEPLAQTLSELIPS